MSKLSGVTKASKSVRATKAKLASKKAALLLALKGVRSLVASFKKREEAFRKELEERLITIESLWEQTELLGGDLPTNSLATQDADLLSSETELENYISQIDEAIAEAKTARTVPKL